MFRRDPNPISPLARYRQLAPNAAVKVSPLCLGAMNFGDAWKAFMGECGKSTSFEILDYYYDQGGNFIDTANVYQDEESEQWIGEWMEKRQNREEMVIATKYTTNYKGNSAAKNIPNFGGNNAKSIKHSVENSLKNLKTDYIDVLYIHWWDYTTSIPELMQSLNDLVAAGKVLYLAISDTPAWVVSKANEYARQRGLRQFSIYQGLWNASFRDFEREIIPMAYDEGMALCPWGTLGQGKFQTEKVYKEREENNEGRKMSKPSDKEKAIAKVLEKIANREKTKITSVAMAYVMAKTVYVFPIIGGRNVSHLKDNIDALTLKLTESDIEEIEDASPFDPGFPHTFLSRTIHDPTARPKGAYRPEDVSFVSMAHASDWVKKPSPIQP